MLLVRKVNRSLCRAVTIVNLVIGLLIFTLILGLVGAAIHSFSHFFRGEQRSVEETNKIEYTFRVLEKELRKANDKVPLSSSGEVTGKPEKGRIVLLNESSLRYAVHDVDGRAEGVVILFDGSRLTISRCYSGEEARLTVISEGLKSFRMKKGTLPKLLDVEIGGKRAKLKRTIGVNVPIETVE